MNVKITFILCCLCFFELSLGSELDLTDANFHSELKKHDIALVMFYAPWCGHCKRLKPDFTKAANELAKMESPVILAKIDCTGPGKNTCDNAKVTGYPTLRIYRKGAFSKEYTGTRTAKGIVESLTKQSEPACKELKTEKDLQAFLDNSKGVSVVSYLTDKSEQEIFKDVANSMRDRASFAQFMGKISGQNGVVLTRAKHMQSKLEESQQQFSEEVSHESLSNWIKDNYHGLVGHRTRERKPDFQRPLVLAVYNVDFEKNAKTTNYWRLRIMKVAKLFNNLNFAISDQQDFNEDAGDLKLSTMKLDKPKIIILGDETRNYKMFIMDEDFTVEAFEKFLQRFEANEVLPFVRSEPIPDSNDRPVKVAVGKTFDEVVIRNPNDVFIMFYAPWCGHCKQFMPIFERIGDAMADEDVEIVKIDVTSNDVPKEYEVLGFPTFYWVPSGTKKPELYRGNRRFDDMISFIGKNAGKQLEGYDREGNPKKVEL